MIVQSLLRPLPSHSGRQRQIFTTPFTFIQARQRLLFAPREVHTVPPLTHGNTFQQQGVPELLSVEGFDLSWTQYQGLMVEKLNRLTAGTEDDNVTTKDLLLKYARQPDMASLFNHASMAHNNHFFFNCISPKRTPIPSLLSDQLAEDFSSLETLRQEFIATGSAMFGPGFVWLVKATDRSQFRLLTTYLAGSPYPGAHYRRQPVDMNSQSLDSTGGLSGADYARQRTVQNTAGVIGDSSGQARLAPGGIALVPILCVNIWEHVWLRDFGVGGKRRFLEAWWERIDWNVVAHNADLGQRRFAKI